MTLPRSDCNVTEASAESLGLSAHRHGERNAGLADSCCNAEFGEQRLLLAHSNVASSIAVIMGGIFRHSS